MKNFFVLSALLVAVSAQYGAEYRAPGHSDVPIPYSFSYVADGDEGSSSHQETGDGSGRVQGSYSLSDVNGRSRVVEYVADEGGFRAVVRTNEPGTANQNPADVIVESTADGSGHSTGGTRPVVRPQTGRGGGGQGPRYVLVPITDPRAAGYY